MDVSSADLQLLVRELCFLILLELVVDTCAHLQRDETEWTQPYLPQTFAPLSAPNVGGQWILIVEGIGA